MARKLETKDFKFTFEGIDEEKGTFSGYASIFGVVDSYGDIVIRGAFKKSLQDQKQFPLLWSHNIMEPIGVLIGREDKRGLHIDGQLNLDVQRAREVRSLMKQGAVEGLSIGYQTLKEGRDEETEARLLKEVKLWEVSPVVFQACPEAFVESVKGADGPPEAHPFPNEHSCRLRDPGDFQPDTFRRTTRKHEGKEYSVIMGKLKSESTMTEQTYRYAKDTWTAEEARAHCKGHDGSFEAASGKCVNCTQNVDIEIIPAMEPGQPTPADDSSKPQDLHLLDKLRIS